MQGVTIYCLAASFPGEVPGNSGFGPVARHSAARRIAIYYLCSQAKYLATLILFGFGQHLPASRRRMTLGQRATHTGQRSAEYSQ